MTPHRCVHHHSSKKGLARSRITPIVSKCARSSSTAPAPCGVIVGAMAGIRGPPAELGLWVAGCPTGGRGIGSPVDEPGDGVNMLEPDDGVRLCRAGIGTPVREPNIGSSGRQLGDRGNAPEPDDRGSVMEPDDGGRLREPCIRNPVYEPGIGNPAREPGDGGEFDPGGVGLLIMLAAFPAVVSRTDSKPLIILESTPERLNHGRRRLASSETACQSWSKSSLSFLSRFSSVGSQ